MQRVTRPCVALIAAVIIAACDGPPSRPGPIDGAPIVHSITPNEGPVSGGTDVTIRGLHFAANATVMIDGRAATNVTVQSNDVITAKSPGAPSAGAVDVVVTTGPRRGTLPRGFTYVRPDNARPVIASIIIQGAREGQPANFADLAEVIALSAVVTDQETPADQLEYHWTASLGMLIGTGANLRWQAPTTATTPVEVRIALRVVERYGMLQHEVSDTGAVSLHDSRREVGDMARRFLTEFSKPQTNRDWRNVMLDFDLAGDVCPDPRLIEAERGDVEEHYTNFVMHNYNIGAANVNFNFGGRCPIRNRLGDACISVPVSWDSTDKRTNTRRQTVGIDYLAAAYSRIDSRWRLCSSDFPRSGQTLGHSLYSR